MRGNAGRLKGAPRGGLDEAHPPPAVSHLGSVSSRNSVQCRRKQESQDTRTRMLTTDR